MPTIKQLSVSLFALFLSLNGLSAQDVPRLTWNNVKDDDLKLKEWRSDSSVTAFVLGDIGTLSMQLVNDYYGFHLTQMRRIKLLKKDGFSYAQVKIPFYQKDETQKIVRIRAQTISPNGERYPLDSSTIKYEPLNGGWSVAKFVFPNITEGCIVEYEYELHSTRSTELHDWFFQDRIPTRFSLLNVDVLSRYEYTHLVQGKNNLSIVGPIKDSIQERTHTTYIARDLAGLRDEEYVTNINNHFTNIHFQLASYASLNGVKHEISSNWKKMAEDLWASENFGQKFLKKVNYNQILEEAKTAIKTDGSTKSKIQKTYDFVNRNLQWDGNYVLFSANKPNTVWQKRTGNSTEINLILLALLKETGFEAYPVLVSTQAHGKTTPEYPVIEQFDHVLVSVDLGDGKSLLLDAGDAARPFGLLSQQATNERGWVLKPTEQIWVDIKPAMNLKMQVAKFEVLPNGHLSGSINATYRNHYSIEQRSTYDDTKAGTPEKGRIEYLTAKNPNWKINDVTSSNLDKRQEPLKETINCTVLNAAKTDNNLLTINPLLKTDWDVNPFKLINRAYPVEFPSLFTEQYIATIAIPTGYKVEELPKDLSLVLPAEAGNFNYQISNDGDKFIKIAVKLEINKTSFHEAEYNDLKGFFRQIAFKFGQRVVLKRI